MSGTRSVKRIISFILASVLVLSLSLMFTACGGAEPAGPASNAGEVVSETDSELTIIDQAGREVTVKKDPQSIALCYRVVVRFLINLGVGDRITGMGKTEEFLEEVQPSLKDCTDVGKGVADIEALAELAPDLFIHKAADTETLEAVQKTGIPAVGIEVETPEDMLTAIAILGKVCGAEVKAEELASYYRDKIAKSEELAASIPDADKKTAIVMGSSIGKVADSSMLQGMMLKSAGAVNCADELKATELWPMAGAEQIFAWDPDYIFITGSESAVYTPEDIYSDPAWSELKAVKNRHIYVIPSKKDSWEFPGIVSALGIDFMMKTMYPEIISDKQMQANIDEFYELAYGRSFGRDELGY